MELTKFNETPVRTSRNYNINNIKLSDIEIPEEINEFNNVTISGTESEKVMLTNSVSNYDITYGVGEFLTNKLNNSNCKIRLDLMSKVNKDVKIEFNIDNKNVNLFENIELVANENSKTTVYIVYKDEDVKTFHNGIIKAVTKQDSVLNIVIVNLLSKVSNNFISLETAQEERSKVNITYVDFGSQNSISNIFANQIGNESECTINSIYLASESQIIDMNFIAELRGEKSIINIDSQGALKDNAKKHFKGTIDFKKGCKKSKGDENEFCILLSDKAKSIALPMLLCSEEDVEGNHSSAAGKIGDKELFYIMSRGFDKKEAMKLMVRAKFNRIIENIKDEEIKNLIVFEMDKRLD